MDITRKLNRMDIRTYNHSERQERTLDREAWLYFAVRVLAGMLLLTKGLYFVGNSHHLHNLLVDANTGGVDFLVSYITFAHICGGVLLMIGLLTRFAVVLQIPIVVGALYYNIAPHALGTGAEMLLSLVVLIMLAYILWRGSGPISMDDYAKRHLL